ncbi:hypothetical protein EV426DRAFT_594384 [Tirmania nivea]|nr:hypothetical protein EV426DRAFT_594384 [Tirmania nivea]
MVFPTDFRVSLLSLHVISLAPLFFSPPLPTTSLVFSTFPSTSYSALRFADYTIPTGCSFQNSGTTLPNASLYSLISRISDLWFFFWGRNPFPSPGLSTTFKTCLGRKH